MGETSPEARWRKDVYRGDTTPQLTTRALATGAVVGAVTGLSNLYVGLKIGWSVGVVVTASVVGWAVWRALRRVGLSRTEPSDLEVNTMASTASAAGYSTGTTLASAVAAHMLLTGTTFELWTLIGWLLCVSALGLFVAVPLRRQLIDLEALPFPSGAAAAQTILGLAGRGGARQGKLVLAALGVGLSVKFATGALPSIVAHAQWPSFLVLPASIPWPGLSESVPWLGAAAAYTFSLECSTLLPAAGVFVGWRVGWSLMLGAIVCYAVSAPLLQQQGEFVALGYAGIVEWSMWPGTTMMVVAGILSLALQWRVVLRATRRVTTRSSPNADIEVPARWVVFGILGAGLGCVLVTRLAFGVPVPFGIASVVLAVALATVAARVTGETDVTPTGPLAKVSQLALGPVLPGAIGANVIAAGVSAGAAASAADLLTDLKSGRILGANPRRQFIAQAVGVVVGTAAVVPVFRYVLVPDASALGSTSLPAPAARMWALLARVVTDPDWVPSTAVAYAMAAAAVVAAVLVVLNARAPRWRPWIPSPMGLGLAFILPASSSIGLFLGAWAARVLSRRHAWADAIVPVAAGLIAGESLMGIIAAVLRSSGA